MVYFMENPIKMDDLGVPLFLETPSRGRVLKIASFEGPMILGGGGRSIHTMANDQPANRLTELLGMMNI